MAARPRTLPAAVAPGARRHLAGDPLRHLPPLAFVAALLGAIFIQVGTNLSNDYSDARRGADTEDRLGPVRVTAGGLVPPRQVLVATYLTFGAAVLCGVYLIAVAGWALLAVGAASILAGVLYTGGPRPYGYEGLGEVFVFLFFGVVAVTGSYFVQRRACRGRRSCWPVPVGLLAAAILVVNNVRDIDTDRRAGKRTLAVRLGRERTRVLFAVMVAAAFVTSWPCLVRGRAQPWLLLPLAPPARRARSIATVRTHADGPTLNGALARTGMLQLAFCVLLSAGILASWRMARDASLRASRTLAHGLRRAARARAVDADRCRRRRRPAAARRRRWSPTTASRSSACRAALETYRPVLAAADPAAPGGTL